jgi:excisionase family DNA binding protein
MSATTEPTTNGVAAHPPSELDVLTPGQAASYLQVREEVVVHEAESGRIPGRKIGGEWRFLRLAIAEWLKATVREDAQAPLSSKERMLALAGMWSDDPTVDSLMAEIAARRKSNRVGV